MMIRYIVKRILLIIPLMLLASFVAFGLMNLSDQDPAVAALVANGNPSPSKALVEQTREELGLNAPFLTRYVRWLNDAVHLDFGVSYIHKKPVSELMIPSFVNTLKLTGVTALVTLLLSVVIGTLCAIFQNRFFDRFMRSLMFILSSMPSYWIAVLLMYLLAYKFRLLPTSGKVGWECYVLPVTSMALGYVAFYFRTVRNSVIDNKSRNYVLYENACGLKKTVVYKHVLLNSMQTTVAGLSMTIPGMLGGAVVIENIFAWPGIGRLCVNAIIGHDLPVVQAYILFLAVTFIGFNLFGDIINALMNPRLRGT